MRYRNLSVSPSVELTCTTFQCYPIWWKGLASFKTFIIFGTQVADAQSYVLASRVPLRGIDSTLSTVSYFLDQVPFRQKPDPSDSCVTSTSHINIRYHNADWNGFQDPWLYTFLFSTWGYDLTPCFDVICRKNFVASFWTWITPHTVWRIRKQNVHHLTNELSVL